MRSCFSSEWRLFRGRAETTRGRYIFAPEDTPAYPGEHNLWSRDWVSEDLEGAVLGELPTARRKYWSGAPIGPVPPPGLLGSAECLRDGERWPLTVVPTLIGGFPSDCFSALLSPPSPKSPLDPLNWCFWAGVVETAYTHTQDAFDTARAALGYPISGYVLGYPNVLTPRHFILKAPAGSPSVVVICGTETLIQWLAQIAYGLGAPLQFGTFATHPVWYAIAATILDELLTLGVDPTQELWIVGHSLGGAVANVLAARLREGDPDRVIRVLTLGAPRTGDSALNSLLRRCQIATLVDESDPVPSVPVNLSDIPPAYLALFAAAYPAGSKDWQFPPNRIRVNWDGTTDAGVPAPGPPVVTVAILLWAQSLGPLPDFGPHLPGEYRRRLCSPVAAPVVWVDAFRSNGVDGAQIDALANLADVANGLTGSATPKPLPTLRREAFNFGAALVFRCSLGLGLVDPVAVETEWTFAAALEVIREFGDSGKAIHDAPIGDGAGTAGPSWAGSSPTAGDFTVTAGGVSASIPYAGNHFAPVMLSGQLTNGTVTAQLSDGCTDVVSFATGGVETANGFSSIGAEFASATSDPYPQLWIGEVLLFDRALSGSELSSVQEYLRLKWVTHFLCLLTESGDEILTESGDPLTTE